MELDAELKERDTYQLHAEYERRYNAQEPPQSEDEIAWRAKNKQRLEAEKEFENSVNSCLSTAEWNRIGIGGAMGYTIKRERIKGYIEKYLQSHGVLRDNIS